MLMFNRELNSNLWQSHVQMVNLGFGLEISVLFLRAIQGAVGSPRTEGLQNGEAQPEQKAAEDPVDEG